MNKGRKPFVVDTNVLIVANKREGGSYACAASCARAILAVREKGTVVHDSEGLILNEYKQYLNYKGMPGLGDAFLRWFFNNRGRKDLCSVIQITHITHAWRKFEEFPDCSNLKSFDPNDQKFVAVAKAHGAATILQASDHKWLSWEKPLREENVKVDFLCREELELVRDSKRKRF